MRTVLLLLLISLAGCSVGPAPALDTELPNITTVAEPTETGPLPRQTLEDAVDVQGPAIHADDQAYRLWQEWQTGSVLVLLISDGRQAARLVLPEGRSVELEMRRRVNVSVGAVGEKQAVISIDGEERFVQEDETITSADQMIVVHLAELTYRG